MVAIISAASWGLIYLFTEALTPVSVSMGFTPGQASLPFMGIVVGVLSTLLPRYWDMRVVRRRRKKGEAVDPYVTRTEDSRMTPRGQPGTEKMK